MATVKGLCISLSDLIKRGEFDELLTNEIGNITREELKRMPADGTTLTPAALSWVLAVVRSAFTAGLIFARRGPLTLEFRGTKINLSVVDKLELDCNVDEAVEEIATNA